MFSRFLARSVGEVRIRVRGASTERFLNVCLRGEIALWDVTREDARTLTATLSVRDFYALRRLMGRTGCRVRIVERHGAPFWVNRIRARWVLGAGVFGLAALLVVLSQFLWVLEIDAAPGVPVGALREILREPGIYEGAYLGSEDTAVTRRAIQTELPEASVVAITRIGNAMRVEVDAAVPMPTKVDRAAPTGLVAVRDGVVSKVTANNGQALVKPGDAVEAGTLLISSAVPNTTEWGQPHRTHGMGRVMAYTSRTAELIHPLSWTEWRQTGQTHVNYALVFGTRRINLYFGSGIPAWGCDKIIEKTRLSIGSRLLLPVSVVRQTYREKDAVPVTQDAQTLGDALAEQWLEDLAGELDGTILESSWKIEDLGDAVRVRVTASCEEQIAAEMIDRTPLPEKQDPEQTE